MASKGRLYKKQGQVGICPVCENEFIINAGTERCCSIKCKSEYKLHQNRHHILQVCHEYEFLWRTILELNAIHGNSRMSISSWLHYCGISIRPRGSQHWPVSRRIEWSRQRREDLERQTVQTEIRFSWGTQRPSLWPAPRGRDQTPDHQKDQERV